MSPRPLELLPKNRVLRRTLYRLLLAAPVLPLLGCEVDPRDAYGDCGTWTKKTWTSPPVALGENEPIPQEPSCDACRPTQGIELRFGCEAKEARTTDSPPRRAYVLTCDYEWCNSQDGRRPEGLEALERLEADSVVGAWHAQVAWMEAASVPAFLRLAEELAAHGAPEALVKAARRSAGDEVRHARVMRGFAERQGGQVPEVDVAPFAPRSLEAMLLENAIEGCVRETFGALSVGWQARTAPDPELRRALRAIARDELRHSELAWAVDVWGRERLSPEAAEGVLQARREALRELEREVAQKLPPEVLTREAGLPSREQALGLLQGLGELVARA